MEYLKNNSYWLLPWIVTLTFSILNYLVARTNTKISNQQYLITEKQKDMQNNSFCYLLYEKRIAIYTDMNIIISRVICSGQCENVDVDDFSKKTREIEFFFGQDIVDLKNKIYDILCGLHRDCAIENSNPISADAQERKNYAIEDHFQLSTELSDVQIELKHLCKTYMDFSKVKIQ